MKNNVDPMYELFHFVFILTCKRVSISIVYIWRAWGYRGKAFC